MTSSDDGAQPFSSLDELRRTNDELLSRLPDDSDQPALRVPETLEQPIKEFVARAAATGALLDAPADRRAAQGLIDYWASIYSMSGRSSEQRYFSGRSDNRLKQFKADVVQKSMEAGESFIQSLSDREQGLARNILLRLTRLPEGATMSVSWPATFETLFTLGSEHVVRQMVTRMSEAGIVTVTAPDGLIALRHEALIRRWPRLHDWIDQRVKFREAALYWLRSGKQSGALLGADLVDEATSYGDLNELEQSFLQASRKFTRWVRFAGATALPVSLGLIFVVYLAWTWVNEKRYEWNSASWTETARSPQATPQDKRKAIFKLASREPPSLGSTALTDINLSGISATDSVFARANLKNVQFIDAVLPNSTFSQSSMQQVHFKGANLRSARFDGAIIADTIFFEAKADRSIFDRAQFCRGVTFARADLSSASFRNVAFERDAMPDFTQTAWWKAVGWDRKQRDWLEERYGSVDPGSWPAVIDQLKELDKDILAEPAPTLERARRLNVKAWRLALYGTKLEEARKASEESLNILEKLGGGQATNLEKAAFSDTLGYILLQLAGDSGGTADTKQALERLKFAAENDPRAEINFRYAVAQFAEKQTNEALASLGIAVETRRYVPSHELYLLRGQIKGEFQTKLESLLARGRTTDDTAQSTCSALTSAAVK